MTLPPIARRKSQRGMALMECLVSILIFSFGVLGLIGLEARGISYSVNSENRNRAALFANDVASYMWLQANVVVSTAQQTAWQASIANAAAQGLPNGTLGIVTNNSNCNAGNTCNAAITITWQEPSTTTVDTLTTQVTLP